MFHQHICLEFPHIRVLNYAPGPLDTDMQAVIRDTMFEGKMRDSFVSMHAEGRLVRPADSVLYMFDLLEADAFENGAHCDYFEQFAVEPTIGHNP